MRKARRSCRIPRGLGFKRNAGHGGGLAKGNQLCTLDPAQNGEGIRAELGNGADGIHRGKEFCCQLPGQLPALCKQGTFNAGFQDGRGESDIHGATGFPFHPPRAAPVVCGEMFSRAGGGGFAEEGFQLLQAFSLCGNVPIQFNGFQDNGPENCVFIGCLPCFAFHDILSINPESKS